MGLEEKRRKNEVQNETIRLSDFFGYKGQWVNELMVTEHSQALEI